VADVPVVVSAAAVAVSVAADHRAVGNP